jgi:DNA-directed RNA polymerase specialized sigma24 family protein
MQMNCDRNITGYDVIKRAQQGDSDAFASLFHTHKTRIYSLCLRMTNNTAEAEDLTQDAFLQVFRKLPTFRGESALSTWLYRVAVNTALMHFRKKHRAKSLWTSLTSTMLSWFAVNMGIGMGVSQGWLTASL